jgi:hypothetical protein
MQHYPDRDLLLAMYHVPQVGSQGRCCACDMSVSAESCGYCPLYECFSMAGHLQEPGVRVQAQKQDLRLRVLVRVELVPDPSDCIPGLRVHFSIPL